jgi:hypothetical protein
MKHNIEQSYEVCINVNRLSVALFISINNLKNDKCLHIGQTGAVHLSGIAHWGQEFPLIIEYIKSFH